MAIKLSTGLRQYLLGEGSVRKAFEDCVMRIYSGPPPASADSAVTGVLLVTVTRASGTVNPGDRSTPRLYQIQLSGTADAGDVVKLLVDGVAYNYTLVSDDNTLAKAAIKVARMLNDIDHVTAVPVGDTGFLHIQGRIDGEDLTITENTSTGITVTVTAKQSAARSNAIHFAKPSAGAMSKATETWSGVVATSGVAGYFRLVTTLDDGTYSTTQVRLQGTVSTSGADLNLSSTSLVAGTTLTIDTFSITLPAE